MTKRLAGAALVAAMVCGWVGQANAYFLNVDAFNLDADSGAHELHVDINNGAVSFNGNWSEQNYWMGTTIDEKYDLSGVGSVVSLNYKTSQDNDVKTDSYKFVFTIPKTHVNGYRDYSINDGASTTHKDVDIYEKTTSYINLYLSYNMQTGILFDTYIQMSGGDYYPHGNPYEGLNISATYDLSSIPLPASAPLFGFGLLGLAFVGCGAKRKQAARV